MTRHDPPIDLGPFTQGERYDVAPTAIGPSGLVKGQGVFFREIGRLHGCYEGKTAEATFGYTAWAASTAYSVGDVRRPTGGNANNWVYLCVTAGTSDSSEPTWPTTEGDTVSDNTVSWMALHNGFRSPDRAIWWPAADKMVTIAPWVQVDGIRGTYGGRGSTAVLYQDRLFVFQERSPVLVYHADQISDTDHNHWATGFGSTHYDLSPDFRVTGKPIPLCREYEETGTVSVTSGGTTVTGSGTNWLGTTNSQVGDKGGKYTYVIFCNSATWDPDFVDDRAYACTIDSATQLTLHEAAEKDFNGVAYKLCNATQWNSMKLGTVWKNMLCGIDGRDFDRNYLARGLRATIAARPAIDADAGGNQITKNVSSPGATNFLTDVRPGDQITWAKSTDTTVAWWAPGLFPDGIDTAVSYSATVTSVVDDDTLDVDSVPLNLTDRQYVIERPLTDIQKRTLYFLGDPGDRSNNVVPDPFDWSYFDVNNGVIIGDEDDGDIIRLVPFEDRLLIFLENAIYQITGDPPVGGVKPANFRLTEIIRGNGLSSYDALAISGDRTRIWFGGYDGIYELVGTAVNPVPVDSELRNAAWYEMPWDALAWSEERLYALIKGNNSNDSYIAIKDFRISQKGEWTHTVRKNSGTSVPSSSPTATYLYSSATDMGGILNPYLDAVAKRDRILVVSKNSGDYSLYSLNYEPDYHTDCNYYHAWDVIFGAVKSTFRAKIREVMVKTSNFLDDGASNNYEEIRIRVNDSEGEDYTTGTADVNPENSDSPERVYRMCPGPGMGSTAIMIGIGDGECPVGEVAQVQLRTISKPHRGLR